MAAPVKGPAWWTSPRFPSKRYRVNVVRVMPVLVCVRAAENIGTIARPPWGVRLGETWNVKPETLTERKGQTVIRGC